MVRVKERVMGRVIMVVAMMVMGTHPVADNVERGPAPHYKKGQALSASSNNPYARSPKHKEPDFHSLPQGRRQSWCEYDREHSWKDRVSTKLNKEEVADTSHPHR